MRATTEIIETVVRYECPKCGANCQCGVPYIPKTMRAAEAIMANPEKSDRAIAADLGMHHSTVNEARKQLSAHPTVERTGLDGKTRRLPARRVTAEANAGWRGVFMRCAADAIRKAELGAGLEYVKGSNIDEEILSALSDVVQAWTKLLNDVQNRRKGNG